MKDAPVIVRGKIGASAADWGREADGGKRIFTYWDVQVAEVLKGAPEGNDGLLRIREMGGEKDGMGMQVSGSASFGAGEDVVVFLSEKNREDSYDVWGLMMGKLAVKKDGDGPEYLTGAAINSLSKPQFYEGDENQQNPNDAQRASKWTLDALRRLIASQGDAPASSRLASVKKAIGAASSSASPTMPESPVPTSSPAAPQLHTSAPEESAFPFGWIVAAGAALLGALGFFFARRR